MSYIICERGHTVTKINPNKYGIICNKDLECKICYMLDILTLKNPGIKCVEKVHNKRNLYNFTCTEGHGMLITLSEINSVGKCPLCSFNEKNLRLAREEYIDNIIEDLKKYDDKIVCLSKSNNIYSELYLFQCSNNHKFYLNSINKLQFKGCPCCVIESQMDYIIYHRAYQNAISLLKVRCTICGCLHYSNSQIMRKSKCNGDSMYHLEDRYVFMYVCLFNVLYDLFNDEFTDCLNEQVDIKTSIRVAAYSKAKKIAVLIYVNNTFAKSDNSKIVRKACDSINVKLLVLNIIPNSYEMCPENEAGIKKHMSELIKAELDKLN